MSEAQTPRMEPAAAWYARRGIAVFPVKARDKVPLTEHGVKDASADPTAVHAWWSRWPNANLGVACGVPSGVLVVDIDGADGEAALEALAAEHGALPPCPEVRTGKGRHLWFAHDERVRNSVKRLPSVDTRSTGGYVLAPPSVHPSGAVYRWVPGRAITDLEPPPPPEWLVAALTRPKRLEPELPPTPARDRALPPPDESDRRRRWCLRALAEEARTLARTPPGGRNDQLNKSAYKVGGYVVSGYLDEDEVRRELLAACEAWGQDRDVRKDRATLERGLEAGKRDPRPVPELERAERPSRTRTADELGDVARRALLDDPAPPRDGSGGNFDAPPPTDDDLGPPPSGGGPDDELPPIFDTFDEHEMSVLADRYLAGDPELHQRGGLLVHVLRDESPGAGVARARAAPRIAQIQVAWLRALTTRRVRWMRYKRAKDGSIEEHRIKPPTHAIAAFHARGHWECIRKLEGVTATPVFRPDGSLCTTPGYDQTTGVLYEPHEAFPTIPERPTRQDADDALEALRYVIQDFPFENAAHEAAWFAAVLTPLARYAFRGPAPCFLIDANSPGVGKGKLAAAAAIIATGRAPTMVVLDHDEREQRKRITSIAIEGDAVVVLDNVEGRFGSPTLCAALTSDEWSDRVLGGSESYRGPLLTTWLATANNAQLTTDMVRRTAHVRVVTNLEHPEERTGFAIPHLEQYVHAHRPRLAAAALTILRGWHCAGRPDPGLPTWGSFEGWSTVVRHALVWAGLRDPGETRAQLRALSDSASDNLIQLVEGWMQVVLPGSRLTTGEILTKAKSDSGEPLREAMEGFAPGKALTSKGIGKLLSRYRGRVVDGRIIRSERDDARKQMVWWVERADPTRPEPTTPIPF
jgi:hypothetical protein